MKQIKLKSIIIVPILLAALSFNSCRDFLNIDAYTKELMSYDSIFNNKINLNAYLWNTAAGLPDEAGFFGASGLSLVMPGISASDEAVNQWTNDTQPGTQFVQGIIDADNIAATGSKMNLWLPMYKIVRKANIIIANVDKCKDLTSIERNTVMGYTYFIRAYAYYHVLMNQGPVTLIGDEVYETNMQPEYYNRSRATYDESVEYICSELERAARLLPSEVTIPQFGRPTKYAAWGLIARLRLQHASPLFNGGGGASGVAGNSARAYFGNWKRSEDGKHYVNQEYDEERWAKAAFAAYRLIKSGKFALHTEEFDTTKIIGTPELPSGMTNKANYPDGPGGIDPYKSYAYMFNGETLGYQNKEFIWGRPSTTVRDFTRHSFPANTLAGWGGMSVPQKIIDAYYMADGSEPIAPGTADCPYDETGFTTSAKTFSKDYTLGVGVYNMYVNREARFYASIGFNQCNWPMVSTQQTGYFNMYLDYGVDGAHGKSSLGTDKTNYTLTGYVCKKYIHRDDAWAGAESGRVDKYFPIIRYAEILFSYAEALNNLTRSWTIQDGEDGESFTFFRDEAEIAKHFNLIRYRAGLPGLTAEQLASKEKMFEAIERERMIEFLHENRRYYDVRRWGLYEVRDDEPIEGMDVEATATGVVKPFYNRVQVNHSVIRNRVVNKKMVFLPISTNELKKVPKFDQNPGW